MAWSPVDDVLAISLEDSSLVVENADGSGRRELLPPLPDRTANPLDRRMGLTWSSDGQWIVFEEDHADHEQAAAFTYVGIRAVRLDGSDEHEVCSIRGSLPRRVSSTDDACSRPLGRNRTAGLPPPYSLSDRSA